MSTADARILYRIIKFIVCSITAMSEIGEPVIFQYYRYQYLTQSLFYLTGIYL